MPKIPSKFGDHKDTHYDRTDLSRATSMHDHLSQNLDAYFQGSVERVVVTGSSVNAFGQLWGSVLHQTAAAFAFVVPDTVACTQNILHLIAALAAARVIEKELAVKVRIHWPKAVYVAGQEVAEIFCDGLVHHTTAGKQILMVSVLFFVSALRNLKTAAEMKSVAQQKEWLLLGLIQQIGGLVTHYLREGFTDFPEEITPYLYNVDKEMQVRNDDGIVSTGKCVGVNNEGELLLSSESGILKAISGGAVFMPVVFSEVGPCYVL